MPGILMEIVVSTVEDCMAAESSGADRVELLAAIMTAGLTPSLGTLIEAKKRVRIPVMVIVRPRAGGFCYSEDDFAVMRRDAAQLLEHGADGIVFGILHADGSVDTKRCEKLLEIAGDKQTVFHRAFDAVPDPVRSLDELIGLGFTRVLTSGHRSVAVEGRDLIRELIVRASQRIEVMPAGGVREHNVRQLVEVTGCTEVLMTAFSARVDASTSASCLRFGSMPGSPSSSYECVDRKVVQRMREILEEVAQGTEGIREEKKQY